MANRSHVATRPLTRDERELSPARERLAVVTALLALAGAAWIATDLRMTGMHAGPGTDPGGIGFYISTWVVMMAATMFPAIAPMVLAYRNLQRRRAQERQAHAGGTGLFLGGYLAVWGQPGCSAMPP